MVLATQDTIKRLAAWFVMAMIMAVPACKEDDTLGKAHGINTADMPHFSTRNVSTLISDSGYTKYKVVTPLWNIYQPKPGDEPDKIKNYWDFPEGVYLRQLDHDLEVVSTVAADSAVYYPDKRLWELYGDVEINQKDRVYFFSQRIFSDDRQKTIYSDTFIHIETPTQILEGIGFESNQSMTKYRILKPTGMFPAKQFENEDNDTSAAPMAPSRGGEGFRRAE